MNLIQSLGAGYFNEFFHNALFMYEGRVHKVVEVRTSNVRCERLHDREAVLVPNSFFMGFKTFNYPILGYRRMSEHMVSYLTRNQSVRRGLNESHIRHQWSPLSTRLAQLGYTSTGSSINNGLAVFEPTYDTGGDLKALLAGEKANIVLSDSVLIEPSTSSNNDWYTIYHKQSVVGSMDYRGRTTFNSNKYENIVLPLLR